MNRKFNKEAIYKFKEAFNIFDIRQTNSINKEDLPSLLSILHVSPLKSELEKMSKLYTSTNGKIKYKDFLKIMEQLRNREDREHVLVEAFENVMEETNTFISVERLKEILSSKGEPFTNEEMTLFINEADPHKTGKVIYKDFVQLLMA